MSEVFHVISSMAMNAGTAEFGCPLGLKQKDAEANIVTFSAVTDAMGKKVLLCESSPSLARLSGWNGPAYKFVRVSQTLVYPSVDLLPAPYQANRYAFPPDRVLLTESVMSSSRNDFHPVENEIFTVMNGMVFDLRREVHCHPSEAQQPVVVLSARNKGQDSVLLFIPTPPQSIINSWNNGANSCLEVSGTAISLADVPNPLTQANGYTMPVKHAVIVHSVNPAPRGGVS